MRQELVKKIDENFLKHGTREELVAVILELLNVVHEQNEKILKLQARGSKDTATSSFKI